VLATDKRTGDIGIASQSKFLAVGALVPFAAAETGAVATQALANWSFGANGLVWLAVSVSPMRSRSCLQPMIGPSVARSRSSTAPEPGSRTPAAGALGGPGTCSVPDQFARATCWPDLTCSRLLPIL
jgi:hypothetical protein